MKRRFEFLYYSYYQIALNAWWNDKTPKFTASIRMSLNIFMLLMTIYFLFMAITRIEFIIDKYLLTIFSLLLLGFVQLYFSLNNKFEQIKGEFDKESEIDRKRARKIANYIFWLAPLATLSSMFYWAVHRGNPLW